MTVCIVGCSYVDTIRLYLLSLYWFIWADIDRKTLYEDLLDYIYVICWLLRLLHRYSDIVYIALCLYIVSPSENDSFRKDFCFTADVLLQREVSEMRGPTGVKFCTMVSTRPYFIVPVQNFGAHNAKKFQGPKTCKIWPDFGRLRSSAANISETDADI